MTLYAAEDDRKLDREKIHSMHANSHLPNGELGGYGYNAINIYISKENRVGDTIAKYESADKLLLTIPRFKCLFICIHLVFQVVSLSPRESSLSRCSNLCVAYL